MLMTHNDLFTNYRSGLVRQLTEDGAHALPAHMPKREEEVKVSRAPKISAKQSTITDLEDTALAPKIKGRIRILTSEVGQGMVSSFI